jgi:hypothetical protein
MWDKVRKGRHASPYKLTEDEVRAIRREKGNFTGRQLAALYNVSPALICDILAGKRRHNVSQ